MKITNMKLNSQQTGISNRATKASMQELTYRILTAHSNRKERITLLLITALLRLALTKVSLAISILLIQSQRELFHLKTQRDPSIQVML
jgi:hypothetical protein